MKSKIKYLTAILALAIGGVFLNGCARLQKCDLSNPVEELSYLTNNKLHN